MPLNKILDADNAPIVVTTLDAIPSTSVMEGVPLGTVGGTTTGELAVKVLLAGGGSTPAGIVQVIGPTDAGSSVAFEQPVTVGGLDATSTVRYLSLNAAGGLASGYSAQVDIARPGNTTAYTAGDVVGGAITIPTIGPSGGRIILTNLALMPQVSAIPAGMTSFRLHLYNVTPPSAIADNAAWTFNSGDWPSYLGYVDLGSPADFGAALFVQAVQVNQEVKLASTSIFGYLVTNGGYTPAANSEVYRLDTYAVAV